MTDEAWERIVRAVAREAFYAGFVAGRRRDGYAEEELWREWDGQRVSWREEEAS